MYPHGDAARIADPSAHAVAAILRLAILEIGAGQELHAACACQIDLRDLYLGLGLVLVEAAGGEFEFEDMVKTTPCLMAQGPGPLRLGVEFVADEAQVCALDGPEAGGYVCDQFGR